MFGWCSSLTSLDLSPLDTSNNVHLAGMFGNCRSLKTLDVTPLVTSSVTNMDYMFFDCPSLTSLDLSGFDTSSVLEMRGMFSGCDSLSSVKLGSKFRFIGGSASLPEGTWAHDSLSYTASELASNYDGSAEMVGTWRLKKPAPTLVDVSDNTAHAEDILWLADEGITTGWSLGDGVAEFRPYDNVARCDMAAFLYRLAGSPEFDPATADVVSFSDVDENTPHYKEVMWLAARGISKGWDNGDGTYSFRPYADIARCDMAAFLHRLAGSPDFFAPGVSFTDVDENTPHDVEVIFLAWTGISTGWPHGDGTAEFRPYATVTRCDMAAFMHRMAVKDLVVVTW